MQDALDESNRQIKILANFDITKEKDLRRLSVYDFMDHILAVHESNSEE